MKNFKEWMGEQPATQPVVSKKWKATKEEILSFWQGLRPNTPIQIKPVDYQHVGSSYGEDGIRITGSREFIVSTIARLKEFMQFENATTKLQLVYRETESKADPQNSMAKSYVFYIQVKERGGPAAP